MYIPIISDFIESLTTKSEEYEKKQEYKLFEEIKELTINEMDPCYSFDIVRDYQQESE